MQVSIFSPTRLFGVLAMLVCGFFSATANADYTDLSLTVEKNLQSYVVNADGSFVLDVELVSRINEERAIKPNAQRSVSFNRTLETLADFVFNVGANNFKTSSLLRVINEQHFAQVPYQLGRWKMAGGKVLPGLEQRRQGEIDLFFDGQTVPKGMLHSGTADAIDIRAGEQ